MLIMNLRLNFIAVIGILILTGLSSVSAQQVQDTTGILLVEGRKLMHAGEYSKAVLLFEKLLTREPSQPEALHSLALALINLGNNARARTYYEKQLKRFPTDVNAVIGVGVTYSNEGRGSEALRYFEQAVQMDSNSILGLTNLGRQYSQSGQVSKALVPLRRAWRLSPNNSDVAFVLAGAFATAKVNDSAEFYYKSAISNGRETFEAFYYLAAVLHRMGKVEEAIRSYRAAISYQPENKDCLRALGQLYIQSNRFSLAEEQFSRLIDLDSTYMPAWQGLGIALALDDQFNRADSIVQFLMYVDSARGFEMLKIIRQERDRLESEMQAKPDQTGSGKK